MSNWDTVKRAIVENKDHWILRNKSGSDPRKFDTEKEAKHANLRLNGYIPMLHSEYMKEINKKYPAGSRRDPRDSYGKPSGRFTGD